MLAIVLIFQSKNWISKEYRTRKSDLDNRIKPVLDAIEQACGISDERYWSITAHKICGNEDRTIGYIFDLGDVVDFHK